MKSVFVMRHAKSSWRDANVEDHDRILNKRGREAAPEMGLLMAARGLQPSRAIVSTARRAVETAELFMEAAELDCEVDLQRRLYLAEPAAIYDLLAEVAPGTKSVLLVGHNPGLAEFVEETSGQSVEMVTAALAHLRFDVDEIAQIDSRSPCKLKAFYRPENAGKSKKSRGSSSSKNKKKKVARPAGLTRRRWEHLG